jgi:hypothetical protein
MESNSIFFQKLMRHCERRTPSKTNELLRGRNDRSNLYNTQLIDYFVSPALPAGRQTLMYKKKIAYLSVGRRRFARDDAGITYLLFPNPIQKILNHIFHILPNQFYSHPRPSVP